MVRDGNNMTSSFYKIMSGVLVTSVLFLYSFPLMAQTAAPTPTTGVTKVVPIPAGTTYIAPSDYAKYGLDAQGNSPDVKEPTGFVYIAGQGDVPIYANTDISDNSKLAQQSAAANQRYESGALGSCIGGILGQAVARAVTGAVSGIVDSFRKVATYDSSSQASGGVTILGMPIGPSWDSIAYCFINTIITYIADSTIAWINSGFNGNPAFLRDPKGFFENMLDKEAGAFVSSLAKGTLGVNACQPIRVEVAIGIAGAYGNKGQGQNATQCTLSKILQTQQGFNAFVSGQPGVATWNNFKAISQNPQNNPNGLYLLSNDIIGLSVAQKSNTIKFDLTANGGFLSYKDCKKVKVKDASGKETTKEECNVVTPGKTIADTASKITGIGTDRLVLAQKFDQVVTALVGQLIKTALNKAFQK